MRAVGVCPHRYNLVSAADSMMTPFKILLFAPGLDPAGMPGEAVRVGGCPQASTAPLHLSVAETQLAIAPLRRAGIAPEGMAAFFARLVRQDGAALERLSSLPASAVRLKALRDAAAVNAGLATTP